VLIGGMPAARMSDLALCIGGCAMISMGSTTVVIAGMPAARVGDLTQHGGAIIQGEPSVLIG
jgi:uncharacterized Zn-binding protein involved in type VI secretion